MNPDDFLRTYPSNLLTIDSTWDYRKKALRSQIDQKYSGLDVSKIAIRYEPDTSWMFIDCGWLGEPEVLDADTAQIFQCSQFMGVKTMRLLKGTGHDDAPRRVYVFDLKKIPTKVQTLVGKKRRAELNRALRNSKRNMAVVAREMQFKDEFDRRLGLIPASFRDAIKEELAGLKRLNHDLLKQVEVRDKIILSLETGKPPKAKRRVVAKDRVCNALDTFIQKNKQHFVKMSRKIDVTGLVNTHDPVSDGVDVYGVLKDTITLLGRQHKVQIYIRADVLREAGIMPSMYRRDPRYVCSQSTYIKNKKDGEAITRYCAVFDMKKKGQG